MPQPKKPRRKRAKKAAKKSPPTNPPSPQPPSPSDPPPIAAAASGGSSTGSAKASQPTEGFISDPGPGFVPGADDTPPLEAPPELHAVPALIPEWDEDTVGTLLTAKGELLHGAIGVNDNDWRYTQADLGAIAPPLTRILNRYPATQAVAGMGDPLALTIGVLGYGIRSTRERAEILREYEEEAEQDVGGVTGEPATVQPPPGHPAAAAPAQAAPVQAPAPPAPAPAPLAPTPPIDPHAVEWQKG